MITDAMRSQNTRLAQLRFKHLRLLELAAERGSVRKAAESLHMSQPAASQMLQEIESALGIPLFERGRRGVVPKPAAAVLISRARVILSELSAMESDALAAGSPSLEIVRMGVLPRCMQRVVPLALARLHDQWPRLQVIITEGSSTLLARGLAEGELDCIVGRLIGDSAAVRNQTALEQQHLYEEGMSLVCAYGQPLGRKKRLTLNDVIDEPWVLPPRGSITRTVFDEEFVNSGLVPPEPSIESDSFLSNLSLVAPGRFLTICPRSTALLHQQREIVRILPIRLRVPLPPISLMWRKSKSDDETLSKIRAAFMGLQLPE